MGLYHAWVLDMVLNWSVMMLMLWVIAQLHRCGGKVLIRVGIGGIKRWNRRELRIRCEMWELLLGIWIVEIACRILRQEINIDVLGELV